MTPSRLAFSFLWLLFATHCASQRPFKLVPDADWTGEVPPGWQVLAESDRDITYRSYPGHSRLYVALRKPPSPVNTDREASTALAEHLIGELPRKFDCSAASDEPIRWLGADTSIAGFSCTVPAADGAPPERLHFWILGALWSGQHFSVVYAGPAEEYAQNHATFCTMASRVSLGPSVAFAANELDRCRAISAQPREGRPAASPAAATTVASEPSGVNAGAAGEQAPAPAPAPPAAADAGVAP